MTQVTVLMTVYNGLPHLPVAVESVLAQTLSDLRLVIVDDGSHDGTPDYLASVQDDRLQVIRQENQGTALAANSGLEHCHTPLVARLDSDDVSLPGRLEKQLAYLNAHPEVGLVGAQMAPLGCDRVGSSLHLPTEHEAIMADLMAGRHGMAHSCIMFRTQLLKDLGGYRHFRLGTMWLNDAWDMMLRMGEVSELANLDEVLHHYRVHNQSLNGAGMQRMRFSIDFARELARRRQAGHPEITPAEFQAQRSGRPVWERLAERVDLYARRQYRLAQDELYGRRRWLGRARLAWAAVCAPQLTAQRIRRVFQTR